MLIKMLKSLLNSAARSREASDGEPFTAFITPVPEPHFVTPRETLDADQASMRLRVGIPAGQLARSRRVCLVPVEYVERDPSLAALGRVQAIVVGKLPVSFFVQHATRAQALLDWVETAARRHLVVVDFSDDLAAAGQMYGQPVLAEVQRRLLAAATATVPTSALRDRLAPGARYGVVVIEDPFESAEAGEPRFAPGAVLQLAWFGVFGPPLRAMVAGCFARIARRLAPRPVEVAFVTHRNQAELVREMASELRSLHAGFQMRHVPWSLDAAGRALREADAVVLPQDTQSAWGNVKSHNRLVETLRAGRFAVASPIPAYRELENYAWVADDLAEGVEWALDHPAAAVERIVAGQRHVSERFAPERIGALWADALQLRRERRK